MISIDLRNKKYLFDLTASSFIGSKYYLVLVLDYKTHRNNILFR